MTIGSGSSQWQPTPDGNPGTFWKPVSLDTIQAPYRAALWRGVAGKYDRPRGMPWSEVFTVSAGKGRVRFESEVVEMAPGVTIELRKGVPYIFEIDEQLEKFAIIRD